MKLRTASADIDLNVLFGEDTAPLALRVLRALHANPAQVFSAFDLLNAAEIENPMEGLLVLARLTSRGLLAHPSLDLYRSTDAGLRVAAAAQAA